MNHKGKEIDMKFSPREIELQNDTNVADYVAAKAELIRKECEAAGSTFYMLPAIPADGTYANVYDYERSMAFSAYSDTHKDAYGYRPRGDFSEWTLETIEEETLKLVELHDESGEVIEEDPADDSDLSKWEKMAFDAGYDL